MAPNLKRRRRPLAAEDPDQLLHPERVCTTLGFCYRTFRRYVEDGLIPVVRIRRGLRVRADVLAQLSRDGVALKK